MGFSARTVSDLSGIRSRQRSRTKFRMLHPTFSLPTSTRSSLILSPDLIPGGFALEHHDPETRDPAGRSRQCGHEVENIQKCDDSVHRAGCNADGEVNESEDS